MAVLSSGSDRTGLPARTHVRGLQFRLMIAAVTTELVAAYLLLRGTDWAFDDNLYLGLAHQHGLTWRWITSTVFGHFSPAYRFGYSVVNHVMPIDYRWVMVVMLCLLGAAAVSLFRVVELLFARTWLAFVVTVWFAGSILFVRAIQWWAFGLQGIPTVLADLLCLYGYLRYASDRSRRWLILSPLSLAFGLAFYEKSAFAPLYILLLRVGFLIPSWDRRSLVQLARRERWIWLGYMLVLAVWFAGYRHYGANLGNAASPTAAQWVRFYEVGWFQSVVPAAFGFGMPWANIYTSNALSTLQMVEIVVLQVVVGAAIVVSIARDRRAWRAWACLLFLFALSGFLTGQARIGLYGPSAMAGDLRYWIDFAWLSPLLACLAFLPRPRLSSERRCHLAGPRPAAGATVAVLLIGYLLAAGTSAHHMQKLWPGVSARAWDTNLERTLPSERRRWPAAVIVQEIVPFYVIEPQLAPLNQLGFLLGDYGGSNSVDGPLRGAPILWVSPSGAVAPATPHAVFRRPLACRARRVGGRLIQVASPHGRAPAGGSAYLVVTYDARAPISLPLTVNTGIGLNSSADANAVLSPESHETIAWLGQVRASRVKLYEPPAPGLCLHEVDVVTLQAPAGGDAGS